MIAAPRAEQLEFGKTFAAGVNKPSDSATTVTSTREGGSVMLTGYLEDVKE
jgi:hypothetical protein